MYSLSEILEITKIIKSNRKTYSIIVTADETVILRCPIQYKSKEITQIIEQNLSWINKHLHKIQENNKAKKNVKKLTTQEIDKLFEEAIIYIPKRVQYFADIMNVTYGNITIRCQKTRYGSCSAKQNLNFNVVLMLMPKEVLDSIVVHELCHLCERNHGPNFYKLVYKYFPEYDKCEKWIKENGNKYMAMLGL